MDTAIKVELSRVFTDNNGNFGNTVALIMDEARQLSKLDRQTIATELSYSETVFIDDLATAQINIFNPQKEVPFAGHAVIGAANLITDLLDKPITSLQCNGIEISTRQDKDIQWIQAPSSLLPPWNYEQKVDAAAVEGIALAETNKILHLFVWAWIDEAAGQVRARTFAPDWGIDEDQGNGSGSMGLALMLNRELEIMHGEGSIIYAKPISEKTAQVGGRVVRDPFQFINQS